VATLNCTFRPWSSSCLNKMTRNWTSQANPEMALPNHLTESPQLRSWKLAYPTAWVNLADGHVIDLPCSEKHRKTIRPASLDIWHICASICSLKSELCWWQFSTSIHISFIFRWMMSTGQVPSPFKSSGSSGTGMHPASMATNRWMVQGVMPRGAKQKRERPINLWYSSTKPPTP